MTVNTFKIFVCEDNEWYNKLLVHSLTMNPEFEVLSFATGKDLIKALHKNPNVITLDYRLPDAKGEDILAQIKEFNPAIEVIMISEQEEIETAVELLKAGAFDYIVKSKDIRDRLLNTIQHIRNTKVLKEEVATLKKEVGHKFSFSNSIIGESKPVKEMCELIEKSLNNNITVTITGETGTGKEVVAKAIHYNSNRKDQAMVSVNMAAIPDDLIESELFGHEKGAFTGAIGRRIGKFEEAHGGTLFLDEMGEMNMNAQAKLLRALQEREITRVGGNEVVKINCRIIVATNRNLLDEVKSGNFREDLYYRLFGLPIHLAPLRERDKDALILAKHFVTLFCKENNMPTKQFSEMALQRILKYSWPGNIRELKSIVELACVLSDNDTIEEGNLTLSHNDEMKDMLLTEMTMREYEQQIITVYMKKYENNTKLIAEKLDIGQTTVYRLLKEMEQQE